MKKMYRVICLFTNLREFVPKIVPLWLKNRNQCVHTGGIMHRALTHGVTRVLRKRWAHLGGGGGGVAYR